MELGDTCHASESTVLRPIAGKKLMRCRDRGGGGEEGRRGGGEEGRRGGGGEEERRRERWNDDEWIMDMNDGRKEREEGRKRREEGGGSVHVHTTYQGTHSAKCEVGGSQHECVWIS